MVTIFCSRDAFLFVLSMSYGENFSPIMLTYKEKLEFLKSLERAPVDLALTGRTINYAHDKSLRKPVLSGLLGELTNLDAYISVMYGVLSQEEWDEVISEYETPIESDHARLREKIRIFLSAYNHLDKHICSFGTEEVLNVFETSLLSRTRNVQFLLFKLCCECPHAVFKFLFKLSHSNPLVFLPYLSSLIVRCGVDEELKTRCIRAYINHIKLLKRSNNIQFVLSCQCILYISCFRRHVVSEAKELIDWMFASGFAGYMNKRVVEMFCELFGYECKAFFSYDHECLYFFPFDPPVFDEIADLVSASYIHFEK